MQQAKNKRLLIIRFAVLYAATLVLLIVLFSAFTRNTPSGAGTGNDLSDTGTGYSGILDREEILRSDYYQLLQGDGDYLQAKVSGNADQLALMKVKSDERLKEFEAKLRLLTEAGPDQSAGTKNELDKIRTFFTTMMGARKLALELPAGSTPGTATLTASAAKEIEQLKSAINDRNSQLADLQARLNVATAMKGAGNSKETDNLRAQLTAMQVKLGNAETQARQLQQQIANTPKPVNNQQQVQQLNAQLAQKQTVIASLQKQVAAKQAAPDNQKALQQLQAELLKKNNLVASLQKQVAAKPKTAAAFLSSDAVTVADLQKRNGNLVSGYKTLMTQMGMLQKNYNILKAENNRLAGKQ